MAIIKILSSSIIIWLVSEFGKRSGKIGGLILSLPVTTIIALLWLWVETKDPIKVSQVTKETLVFILPSLVFFIALPFLLEKQLGFYLSFISSLLLTMISYFIFFKLRGEL